MPANTAPRVAAGIPDPGEVRFLRLEEEWARLADRYLPVKVPGGAWRFSGITADGVPTQGWKLHLSATILSAGRLLRKVGPILAAGGEVFKGPVDLVRLDRLNSGIDGFSQVGKCITVYCRSGRHARALAADLHAATAGIPFPTVPFDRQYLPGSNVHYRFGAFGDLRMEDAGGNSVAALRGPGGVLIPDQRAAGSAVPAWKRDPFGRRRIDPAPAEATPLATRYRAFEAIKKRGKGGVYWALDLSVEPARLCVLKEGLRHGETDPYGHDGRWRLRNEARAIRSLRSRGVVAPAVYATFEASGHAYLVMEYVEGPSLEALCRDRRRLASGRARSLAIQLISLVRDIHAAGWAWRDCKPENLVQDISGVLRPLDFEGACRLDEKSGAPWGTPPYMAPRPPAGGHSSPAAEDLYSLGMVLRRVLVDGRTAATAADRQVRRFLEALVDPDPARRPPADAVLDVLA